MNLASWQSPRGEGRRGLDDWLRPSRRFVAAANATREEKHFWCAFIEVVEHLVRHRQKVLVEDAHQRHRPFGQARILGEQRLVLDEGEAVPLGKRAGLLGDQARALLAVEDHFRLAQLLHIIREALHTKRLWRHEAVAARLLAASDAVDLEIHHLAVEQAEDRVERAHPAKPARAPAHRFRPGEAADDLGHDPGDDLGGRAARLLDQRHVIGAFLVVALLGLVDRGEPRRLEEAFDRGLGRIDARTFRSSLMSGERAGRPSTTAVRRRGVAKVLMSLNSSPASRSARRASARDRPWRGLACARGSLRRTAQAGAQP